MEKLGLARNGQIFKAAWQRSLEENIKQELLPIAKKHTDAACKEMNQKLVEIVASIQARLIMNEQMDQMNGVVTMQLLLPKEMTMNPPDGGQV